MREAYLVNNSQSIVSIPLYEKVTVKIGNRNVQKVQFKKLVPTEELILGTELSSKARKYYNQFRPIMVDLKFRVLEDAKVEDKTEDEEPTTNSDETVTTSDETTTSEDEEPTTNSDETESEETEAEFNEADLKRKRQSELIEIATSLGLSATKDNSKAEIIKMILGKADSE